MSEPRKLPSQLVVIATTEAGEVLQEVPEPTPTESRVAHLNAYLLRGAQVLDMEPQQWRVPNWLPSNAVVAVYAAPGIGKSFYALTLALEIARGGSWLGAQLNQEKVLYIAAEKATTLRDRAEAWCAHHNEMLPEEFLLVSTPRPPQLSDPISVQALCELIKAENVRFVILDTYAMMLQGIEENSSKESGVTIEALSQIRQATNGGTVLVVHHSGKDSSKGLRGSSALLAAVDLTIEIASNGLGRLQATVRKSNAGSEPMPEHYTLTTVHLEGERSSAVLLSTGAPAANPELEALVVTFLTESPSGCMSASQLREAMNETLPKQLSRSTFERQALNPLLASGKLEKQGTHKSTTYRLTQQA
jgi:adenosyl cobinamide kinase/adenosyl cobinamide phosphate guanylyltransferase